MSAPQMLTSAAWPDGVCRRGHAVTTATVVLDSVGRRRCGRCVSTASKERMSRPATGPEVRELPAADWRDRGNRACDGMATELFFPVGSSGPALPQIARAKSVCAGCPVRRECGEWALESGQDYGIWGGMTEQERREISRQRKEGAA